MPDQPHHLRIFLASPGDVAEERELALKILADLPDDPLLSERVTLKAIAWDKPGTGLDASLTPQEAIARQLPQPADCDIVIVIFWSRMGTPLFDDRKKPDGSPYWSGTEWEFWNALRAAEEHGKPRVLLYRRTEKPPRPDLDDRDLDDKREQWQRVNAFFDGLREPNGAIRHSVNDYATPEDFREKLEHWTVPSSL